MKPAWPELLINRLKSITAKSGAVDCNPRRRFECDDAIRSKLQNSGDESKDPKLATAETSTIEASLERLCNNRDGPGCSGSSVNITKSTLAWLCDGMGASGRTKSQTSTMDSNLAELWSKIESSRITKSKTDRISSPRAKLLVNDTEPICTALKGAIEESEHPKLRRNGKASNRRKSGAENGASKQASECDGAKNPRKAASNTGSARSAWAKDRSKSVDPRTKPSEVVDEKSSLHASRVDKNKSSHPSLCRRSNASSLATSEIKGDMPKREPPIASNVSPSLPEDCKDKALSNEVTDIGEGGRSTWANDRTNRTEPKSAKSSASSSDPRQASTEGKESILAKAFEEDSNPRLKKSKASTKGPQRDNPESKSGASGHEIDRTSGSSVDCSPRELCEAVELEQRK